MIMSWRAEGKSGRAGKARHTGYIHYHRNYVVNLILNITFENLQEKYWVPEDNGEMRQNYRKKLIFNLSPLGQSSVRIKYDTFTI